MYPEKGNMIMFLRFILLVIIGYVTYRLIKSMIKTEIHKSEIRGKPKKDTMNLDNEDIEDAKFEEIDEDK